ncbi:MAG: Type 1 glutamine amidotransferase-like domain-containing protein [Candidatus Saccharimonas sp.]|nr:Type 1 glutamine amidotransferase-like domain-containing protein [Planctomycetaceae bacterium]
MNRIPFSVALLIVTLLGASRTSRAEESLLGLPQPQNTNRPGCVVLHGGGLITQDVFDRFVELAGGKNARIVLIPSAGYRLADYPDMKSYRATLASRYSSWVQLKIDGRVADFRFLTTDNPNDANHPEFVRPLESATGVWFSGGDQGRLNYRYVGEFPSRTRFQDALLGVVQRGGVVGGTSAGTAAMPEIMTLCDEADQGTSRSCAVAAHGLGLFDRAIVEQHFSTRGGRLERFTDLLKDRVKLNNLARRPNAAETMIGIAIEERSAVVAKNNRLEVLGETNSHVFLKTDNGRTVQWCELEPGEAAQLMTGPGNTVRLLRR